MVFGFDRAGSTSADDRDLDTAVIKGGGFHDGKAGRIKPVDKKDMHEVVTRAGGIEDGMGGKTSVYDKEAKMYKFVETDVSDPAVQVGPKINWKADPRLLLIQESRQQYLDITVNIDWGNGDSVAQSFWFKGYSESVKGEIKVLCQQYPRVELVCIQGGLISQLEVNKIRTTLVKEVKRDLLNAYLLPAIDVKELSFEEFKRAYAAASW